MELTNEEKLLIQKHIETLRAINVDLAQIREGAEETPDHEDDDDYQNVSAAENSVDDAVGSLEQLSLT